MVIQHFPAKINSSHSAPLAVPLLCWALLASEARRGLAGPLRGCTVELRAEIVSGLCAANWGPAWRERKRMKECVCVWGVWRVEGAALREQPGRAERESQCASVRGAA